MPRTKQRTPALRERVVEVALDLLEREGAGGLTTRVLARASDTSTPAVYELFGDKSGLVRELFFEGFRLLLRDLVASPPSGEPLTDLVDLAQAYRRFVLEHRALSEVMFSRPFTDFSPGPDECRATASVRLLVVERVQLCVDAGLLEGDATDIAHVVVALIQGMAGAENAGRLGTTAASIARRWGAAIDAVLQGFSPSPRW